MYFKMGLFFIGLVLGAASNCAAPVEEANVHINSPAEKNGGDEANRSRPIKPDQHKDFNGNIEGGQDLSKKNSDKDKNKSDSEEPYIRKNSNDDSKKGDADKPAESEVDKPSLTDEQKFCAKNQPLLHQAWILNTLLRVGGWEEDKSIAAPQKNKEDFFELPLGKKDKYFNKDAHIGVEKTQVELEVKEIYSDTLGKEGLQQAVLLKDTQEQTYYVAVKTSEELFSANFMKAYRQLSSIRSQVLDVFSFTDSSKVCEKLNPKVGGTFIRYASAVAQKMQKGNSFINYIQDGGIASATQIVFIGHSLAGPLAQILATQTAAYLKSKNVHAEIEVWMSGSPKVGNADFSKCMEELGIKVIHFVYQTQQVTYNHNEDLGTAEEIHNDVFDPITCFPGSAADGYFRSSDNVVVAKADGFFSLDKEKEKDKYDKCDVSSSLLNLGTLASGYWSYHLPAVYDGQYKKIEKHLNNKCSPIHSDEPSK